MKRTQMNTTRQHERYIVLRENDANEEAKITEVLIFQWNGKGDEKTTEVPMTILHDNS